jgi:hypothetical protein
MKNIITSDQFDHIHNTCKKYDITNYTINPDGSIDVKGNVEFEMGTLSELGRLPLRFNKVSGLFTCSHNGLTTLDGAPSYVGKSFSCYRNNISNLKGGPKYVGARFDCSDNDLTTLAYFPEVVKGWVICFNTPGGSTKPNMLPKVYNKLRLGLKKPQKDLFFKFMHKYEVYDQNGELDEEMFNALIEDINDGLR